MTQIQTHKALRRSALAIAMASAFATPAAHALDVTWWGGTGEWGNALGWNALAVPNATDINIFIDGGSLTNSALTLSSSATIGSLHIDAFDALTLANGAVLTMHGGTLTNNGTLALAGATHYTRLNLANHLTLAGSGQTVLGDAPLNLVTSSTNDKTLTIAAGHTLRGGGGLGNGSYGAINVVNQGTVRADASTGMTFYGTSFDNTAGVIQVSNGSFFNHATGTLSGGAIQGNGTSALSGAGTFQNLTISGGFNLRQGNTYTGVTFEGSNTVVNGAVINASGTLTNNGTLALAGTTHYTRLNLADNLTLAGSGQTVLGDAPLNLITSNSNDKILTIAAGHTLRGGGGLGNGSYGAINVVNQGTVRADASTGMTFYGTSFDNTGGTLQVADLSYFNLSTGSLYGGVLAGSGSAHLTGGGVYRDLTLTGSLAVKNATTINASGTLTNNGTLALAGTTHYTRLNLTDNLTLAGSGQTVLGDAPLNLITSNTNDKILTIGAGHTLRGGGGLGNGSYGAINVVNQGTVRADASTGMTFYGTSFDNTAGVIQVSNGSFFNHATGTLSGGAMQGNGTSALSGAGTFQNLTLSGGFNLRGGNTFNGVTFEGGNTVVNGAVINARGTLTNNGTLALAGTTHYTRLNLTDNLTLAGSGQTVLGDAPLNLITSNTNDKILTIGAGHTLRGGGGLGNGSYGAINVVNQGTVRADASSGMATYGSTFDNTAGTIEVAAGSTLHVNSALLLADASRMTFEVDGLQAGTQFGVLALTTAATFDGQVTLDLSGFAAQVGDSFAFISFAGTGSGLFDAVNAAGYSLSVSYADHHVTATIAAITAVPEPGTYALMLGGLGWLGWVTRRRSARHNRPRQ